MNNIQKKSTYVFQQNWFLGFIGFWGCYKLYMLMPELMQGKDPWLWLNVLWLLWFAYFLPDTKID